MTGAWVVLSTSWSLEDVQAGLTVLIAFFCIATIWATGYASWKSGVARVRTLGAIPIVSVLSVSSLSEAWDVSSFFHFRLLSRKQNHKLFLQCIIVTAFSVVGFLSGPLARFATRRGVIEQQQKVKGSIVTMDHQAMIGGLVQWNETIANLNQADFPRDQLLDYVPDTVIPWKYRAHEWNSSWSVTCFNKPLTTVAGVRSSGNYSGGFFDEVPGLRETYDRRWSNQSAYASYISPISFFEKPSSENVTKYRDSVVFVAGMSRMQNNTDIYSSSREVLISAYHFRGIPSAPTDSDGLYAKADDLEPVQFTQVNCTVSPSAAAAIAGKTEDYNRAYVWMSDSHITDFVSALALMNTVPIIKASIADQPIPVPGPDEFVRFLQVYYATRDTQYHLPTQRLLTVSVETVEVATAMIAVLGLLAIAVGVVLIKWGPPDSFKFWNKAGRLDAPMSKLDWMAQAVKESGNEITTLRAEPQYSDKPGSASVNVVNVEEIDGYHRRLEVEAAAIEATGIQTKGPRRTKIRRGVYQTA